MWQALVTVCFIEAMSKCIVLESQQWFETELMCKARAFEMAEDVHRYMRSHNPTQYKCHKLAGGMLTK